MIDLAFDTFSESATTVSAFFGVPFDVYVFFIKKPRLLRGVIGS
jgi:hypothetical protein